MNATTTVRSLFRSASIAGILVGAAALMLSTAGCAQQNARPSATGEQTTGDETALVSDVQQPAETPVAAKKGRVIVTKHGPRRSR